MEVPGVQRAAPDGFIDAAELDDGEFLREERRGQRGVLDLCAGAVESVGDDAGVVEGERAEGLRTGLPLRRRVVGGPGHGTTPVDPVPRTLLWGTRPGRVRFGESLRSHPFGALRLRAALAPAAEIQLGDGDPGRGRGVAAAPGLGEIGREGQVGDGHDGHARVAPGIAVRPELFEVDALQLRGVQPRFLGEFAGRGRIERLPSRADESARQRPGTLEGPAAALDEQDVQGPRAQRQRDDVDGHGDGGELSRVVGGEECTVAAAVLRGAAPVALPVRGHSRPRCCSHFESFSE